MRGIVSRLGVIVVLSAAALMAQAAPQSAAVYQGQAAEDFLVKAKIVSTRPLGEGVTRPYRVELELDGVT
ncbi:MAG: hypothetical protein ABIP90_01180, partial [Vicinamibacterales bacterium]